MRVRTTLEEMREHVELADYNDLASEQEKDERLDCALDCACQYLAERLEETWSELRTELEDVRGVPYIYVGILPDTWQMISPLFAEIEGEPTGYALSPLLPSAKLILSQLAQTTSRRSIIENAHQETGIHLLIVHAYAPPVVMQKSRKQVIDELIKLATFPDQVDRAELGAWGAGLVQVTLLTAEGITYCSTTSH